MKNKLILLMTALGNAALISCAQDNVTTSSRTLTTYDPNLGGSRIALIADSDLGRFRPSNDKHAAAKAAISNELQKKGWVVMSNPLQADYGLMWMCGLRKTSSLGYSFYGNSMIEDRLYTQNCHMELVRSLSNGAPGDTVWTGMALLSLQYLNKNHPAHMASCLIKKEFPARAKTSVKRS